MSSAVHTPRSRRRMARRAAWVWTAVIAIVLTAAGGYLWATGGFRRGTPFLGPAAEPGRTIATRFWDVAISSASLPEGGAMLSVQVEVTNRQDEPQASLTREMLVVRLSGGRAVPVSSCSPDMGTHFQPDIRRRGECSFLLGEADEAEPSPKIPTVPFDVQVVVLDQEMSNSFLGQSRPQASGRAAGWVALRVEAGR